MWSRILTDGAWFGLVHTYIARSHIYAQLFAEADIDLMIYSSTADALLGPPTTEAGVMAMLDYSQSNLKTSLKSDYLSAKKVIWKTQSIDPNVAGYARCTYVHSRQVVCTTTH